MADLLSKIIKPSFYYRGSGASTFAHYQIKDRTFARCSYVKLEMQWTLLLNLTHRTHCTVERFDETLRNLRSYKVEDRSKLLAAAIRRRNTLLALLTDHGNIKAVGALMKVAPYAQQP